MTRLVPRVDWSLLPVQVYHACPSDRACAHCKAGRLPAPVEAGVPGELDAVCSEIDQALRFALPPAFHRPRFMDLLTPKLWVCSACWEDDGNLTAWPCQVATAHGNYIERSMHLAEIVRTA